jgi:hypothetical protein
MPIFIDPAKAHWVTVEHAEIIRLRDAERRLAELQEAVRWERECEFAFCDNGWSFWLSDDATNELVISCNRAFDAVDALVGDKRLKASDRVLEVFGGE